MLTLLGNIYMYILGLSAIGAFLTSIVLMITVGKKIDKLFKDRKPLWDLEIPFYSMGARTTLYAACCASTYYNKLPYQQWLYDGYNFKENSTLFDRIISTVYIIFCLVFVIFGFIFYIFHWVIPFFIKLF